MKQRVWGIGATALTMAIVLIGWVFGVSPGLSLVAKTNSARATIVRENLASQAELIRLKKDYLNIASLHNELSDLRSSVPTSASIPRFVSELNSLASLDHVSVKSLSVSDARPYLPVAPTSANQSPSSAVTNAKITTSNFVLIPIQFSITGGYANVLDFIKDLQRGERLFLVSTFTSTGVTDTTAVQAKSADSQPVDATIGGFIYVIVNPAE